MYRLFRQPNLARLETRCSEARQQAGYWRVAIIQRAVSWDDRCIMLSGKLGEIAGPMTMAVAETWMDHFDIASSSTQKHTPTQRTTILTMDVRRLAGQAAIPLLAIIAYVAAVYAGWLR